VPFDHSQTLGLCKSCHDGVIASEQSPGHVETNDDCGSCHTTTSWFVPESTPNDPPPPTTVDHNALTEPCVTCHDNTESTGKPDTHPPTTDACEICHGVDVWLPLILPFDHSQTTTDECTICHNGTIATGKGDNHIVTSLECSTCHTTEYWVLPTFDHAQITTNCVVCHNGINATGKSDTHIETTLDCHECHTTSEWLIP
jgi:hypothetical protein